MNQPYMSPRGDVERKMAQIWEGVFDLRSIGIYDTFFDSGGHSLMATRIISKVAETFGVELTMRNFLDAPAVAGLAGIVATLSGSKKNAEQVISESTCGDETGEI